MRRLTGGLTARAVLVTCLVALISVLGTALVAFPVSVNAANGEARETLTQQTRLVADVLGPRIGRTASTSDEERVALRLRTQGIDVYLIRSGTPDRAGLPPRVVRQISAGHHVRAQRAVVDGQQVLVAGRALGDSNGVVLTQETADVAGRAAWRWLWLALLAGLGAGILAGVLLARRLARPIRHAATAAARLSAGDRSVRLAVEPPTEAEDLANALNNLAAALAASEGRQREFLLSVSHELRTPLTTIKGYAEALADGVVGEDHEGAQRAGQIVLAEAERLDRLVADLLALARLEAAEFAIQPIPVDLAELVRSAGEAWRPRCASAEVPLRTEVAGSVLVSTDPGRLRQVIDGLVENALRVIPAGAPLVIAARAEGAVGIVEVRDGGPGFTDDDLAVAFRRGELHHRYRGVRAGGSGLGLALAAGLVHRLGGTIDAGHAAEGGARFTVAIPMTAIPVNPYQTRTPG